ncbi:MAG: ATP-dependent Clp protease proteolytic subunit [Actinomycetota bacterium]|nr:ATP-dependent Clp protease proteolytic subunit [Actinomycetota bacterium]
MLPAAVPGLTTWPIGTGRRLCVFVLALLATLAVGGLVAGDGRAQSEGFAYSVELEGEVDRTMLRDLERALEEAEKQRARLVILLLDTPGGDLETTRSMSNALLASPLPVVVYVAPDGARAGSAGVFVTMAGDVAAMAPQTNIGSASPILVGPDGVVEVPPTLYRKIVNDATAYVRALAEGHGRNADLAERTVREATNVTASEARREGLVDLVAGSEAQLLERLDGFRVKGGKATVLRTAGLRVVRADLSASADEELDVGDDTLVLGLGMPGLIFLAMFALVIVLLARNVLVRRPRRRRSR